MDLSFTCGLGGLTDVGYRPYFGNGTAAAARSQSGLLEGPAGTYNLANYTAPAGSVRLHWDVTSYPLVKGVDYLFLNELTINLSAANTTLHAAISAANTSIASANTSIASANTTLHAAITAATSNLATASALSTVGTNVSTLLSRLGSFTGSGVNTVLGFFKALLGKDASTPSDIGGDFSPATDSLEAIRDNQASSGGANTTAIVNALGNLTIGNGTDYDAGTLGRTMGRFNADSLTLPLVAIPSAPADPAYCACYGTAQFANGTAAANHTLEFGLMAANGSRDYRGPWATEDGRLISATAIPAIVAANGSIGTAANATHVLLVRTDEITPAAVYRVTSDGLELCANLTLEASTYHLGEIVI